MDSPSSRKNLRLFRYVSRPVACKCLLLVSIALFYRALLLYCSSGNGLNRSWNDGGSSIRTRYMSDSDVGIRRNKFLEVPQIVWGLNNQKIAFARACLTARMLNRSLLMPSLSASLFYKELDKLNPISFDKVFRFDRFNSLCSGFVQIARFSDPRNGSDVFDLMKGSGRRWTVGRDLEQLREASEKPIDDFEVIRIVGKNPFLWHDHWPVKDYAKVFECMEVVDEIGREADKVVMKVRRAGEEAMAKLKPGLVPKFSGNPPTIPYVAVHMRIEIDWMIHCKKLEQRKNVSEICSSKEQIMERVGNVVGSKIPVVVYLAVADSLLEDSSILTGWRDGLLPYEKKTLGVEKMYKKYPYLIQSAIDYEVCSRADVFFGNSFSTFSSLVTLGRTHRAIRSGITGFCGENGDDDEGFGWRNYAYNLRGKSDDVPRRWMTNMSEPSLEAISYGSNDVSCISV
ncbi:PREDICTED: uncharacterized protein LOC104798549 [Tarenaya hassleriana]|uniref:uncharacterized protein LOC104798549 n=1 Tax=Tarenaya hassleriana TaxID=28532 RepID=UPI00053C341A|nr:PREDICTED: uncharacterized protein LOC104798549 [Tarenaya hassleriana]